VGGKKFVGTEKATIRSSAVVRQLSQVARSQVGAATGSNSLQEKNGAQ
jgi:hypothetical protein